MTFVDKIKKAFHDQEEFDLLSQKQKIEEQAELKKPENTNELGNTEQFNISVSLTEGDDKLSVCAEIPGVSKKDLKIFIMGSVIKICAKKAPQKFDGKKVVEEILYGHSERLIELPCFIIPQKCQMDIKDGIINITLEKFDVISEVQIFPASSTTD